MLRRTFLRILAAVFPASAVATTIPEPKSYLHGFRMRQLEILPVPRTAQQLYDSINRLLDRGASTNIGWSVTGERYLECAVGMRLNDQAEARLCEWAWKRFRNNMQSIPDVGSARIYWRIKPEIVTFDANEDFDTVDRRPLDPAPTMRLYMRYLVSAMPVLVSPGPDGESRLFELARERRWRISPDNLRMTELV